MTQFPGADVSRVVRQIWSGLVDPGDVGDACCDWSPLEAVGFEGVGVVEDGLAVFAIGVVVAVVDVDGCVVADAGVAVAMVVVSEEGVDEGSGAGGSTRPSRSSVPDSSRPSGRNSDERLLRRH